MHLEVSFDIIDLEFSKCCLFLLFWKTFWVFQSNELFVKFEKIRPRDLSCFAFISSDYLFIRSKFSKNIETDRALKLFYRVSCFRNFFHFQMHFILCLDWWVSAADPQPRWRCCSRWEKSYFTGRSIPKVSNLPEKSEKKSNHWPLLTKRSDFLASL